MEVLNEQSKIDQLNIWTPQLIVVAEKIIKKRILFIENLKKVLSNIKKFFSNLFFNV